MAIGGESSSVESEISCVYRKHQCSYGLAESWLAMALANMWPVGHQL
jgi:hypothetical protein